MQMAFQMEKAEKEALFLVIRSLVGDWWNGSELYPDPCGWTPIQGVSCDLFDGLWYVTSLNIGPVLDNSLECSRAASIAPSLFNLRRLKALSVYDCFSSGQKITIPSLGWENLASSLETLEFRSNPGLTGGMPPGLGRLTGLRSLVLVENSLSGELPTELGNLVHLKRLSLGGNMFSGQIPASVGYSLNELLIFDASRNSLTGPLPPSLGGLASLLKLDLSSNLLHGSLPRELGSLRSLTLLDLRSNNLSGAGLSQALEGLAPMQDLLLSSNPLGGSLAELKLERLRNLTNLDLSKAGLSGTIPESIARLERLRFLALDNNHLSGSIPRKLEGLPSLGALYVNANNLTGRLEFSGGFYGRMGRRFASWDNPGLCYSAGGSEVDVPFGVEECKDEGVLLHNSKNRMGEENPQEDLNLDHDMASVGFSGSSSTSGFWWMIVGQDLAAVVVFLLVLFLQFQ